MNEMGMNRKEERGEERRKRKQKKRTGTDLEKELREKDRERNSERQTKFAADLFVSVMGNHALCLAMFLRPFSTLGCPQHPFPTCS